MFGTRYRPLEGARAAFVPLSVLALLAFLCVPVLAAAEDASDIEYKDVPPPAPSKSGPASSSGSGGVGADGQASGGSGSKGSSRGSGADGGSSSDDDRSGGAAGGSDGGNRQGSQAGGAANETGVGSGYPIDDGGATSRVDGSSPLAPILIALAILAAISIGAVAIRQRRQGGHGGGSRSGRIYPEAG